MNLVDIIILAILGVSLISGMYKGFLTSGLAIIGFIAAWLGAMYFYPQISAALQTNESIMSMFSYYLDAGSFFESGAAASTAVSAVNSAQLGGIAADMNLPASILTQFTQNVLSRAFESLNIGTLSEYLTQTICCAACNIISFIFMFAVSYIVVLLIVKMLNDVCRFPMLRNFDWLLGGVFGLARGAVVVVLIISVIPLLSNVLPAEVLAKVTSESMLYKFFDRPDLLEKLISSIF